MCYKRCEQLYVTKEAFVVATLRLTLWHKEGVYGSGRWEVGP